MTLQAIESRWSACTRCYLSKTRRCVLFGYGHPKARLAIIGDTPDESEDREGRLLVGKAGILLGELCESAQGPEPWSCFITNTLGCRPPKNYAPPPEAWAACRPRLYGMLAIVRPRAIVILGGTALGFLTGAAGIGKLQGTTMRVAFRWKGVQIDIPAVPTFHPNFLLRQGDKNLRRLVANDIRKAWALADGPSWIEGGPDGSEY